MSYPFFQTYVRISPSDMNDFSLRDLPTFYLPRYMSIMFRNSVPSNLMINIHDYFDNFLTLTWSLDHIVETMCGMLNSYKAFGNMYVSPIMNFCRSQNNMQPSFSKFFSKFLTICFNIININSGNYWHSIQFSGLP